MLLKVLQEFTVGLSDYLKRTYVLKEEIVELQAISTASKVSAFDKICISLINIERETAAGIRFNTISTGGKYYKQSNPSWQLNLYILIAAVFSEKQYAEALRLLSAVCFYLQSNPIFGSINSHTFTVEPVNLSLHELSNLWSISGGSYQPSVVCRIRLVNIDGEEIGNFVPSVEQKEIRHE